MKIVDILNEINTVFPLSIQEEYDNSGSQIEFPDIEATGILLCLDVNIEIINEAIEKGCNLIITHHPLIFQPLKRIISTESTSNIIIQLIENKISLYSIHTNLDKVYYDKLAKVLGFPIKGLLINKSAPSNDLQYGFGTLSELPEPVKFKELLSIVKNKLKLDHLVYSGNENSTIKCVAVLNGSGGGSIEMIIKNYPVDCIITGDVGYHHSKYAIDNSIPLIDAGHFGTEKILIDFLYNEVNDCLKNFNGQEFKKIYVSQKEKNPFNVYK